MNTASVNGLPSAGRVQWMQLGRTCLAVFALGTLLGACAASAPRTTLDARAEQVARLDGEFAVRPLEAGPIDADEFWRTDPHGPRLGAGCAACGTGLGIGRSDLSSDAIMRLAAGEYRCELDRRVTVRSIAGDRSVLVLRWNGQDFSMRASESRTGALRYEDPGSGLTWLTIVGKSILLDSRKGRQLANECKL